MGRSNIKKPPGDGSTHVQGVMQKRYVWTTGPDAISPQTITEME